MRVLLITDWNRGRGGAEAYMGWLRAGLESAGDDVRLLTSSAGSAGDGTADYVAYGSEQMSMQAFLQVANPFAIREVRRALDEFRPDVALVNMFAHHLSPAILHAMGDVPIVLTVSDYKCICPVGSKLLPDGSICTSQPGRICHAAGCVSLPHWLRDLPRYALLRRGIARASRVLACSEYVKAELALSGIESECIYLPVPPPGRNYVRNRSPLPRILYCGRLDREKGVEQLLRAFSIVLTRDPEVTLRIAGQGSERMRLESLSRELGLAKSVSFLGWLEPDAIESEISAAWALAAPSLWAEPLGLVALEAIIRGVPVVVSSVGGFAETVEEGVTGTLLPNGDVGALANAIASVVSGDRFPSGVSSEATRRLIDRHDIGRHVTLMQAMFREIAD